MKKSAGQVLCLTAAVVAVAPMTEPAALDVRAMSITELAQRADVILLATVTGVSGSDDERIARLVVSEVWKGEVAEGIEVRVSPTWTCDISTAYAGEHAIWLLDVTESGQFVIAHSGHGRMPLLGLGEATVASFRGGVWFPEDVVRSIAGPKGRPYAQGVEIGEMKRLVAEAIAPGAWCLVTTFEDGIVVSRQPLTGVELSRAPVTVTEPVYTGVFAHEASPGAIRCATSRRADGSLLVWIRGSESSSEHTGLLVQLSAGELPRILSCQLLWSADEQPYRAWVPLDGGYVRIDGAESASPPQFRIAFRLTGRLLASRQFEVSGVVAVALGRSGGAIPEDVTADFEQARRLGVASPVTR